MPSQYQVLVLPGMRLGTTTSVTFMDVILHGSSCRGGFAAFLRTIVSVSLSNYVILSTIRALVVTGLLTISRHHHASP